MESHIFSRVTWAAIGALLAATPAFSQTAGPGAKPGWPGWVLVPPVPQGAGGGLAAVCKDDIAKYCTGQNGFGARGCLTQNEDKVANKCKEALDALPPATTPVVPGCTRSPICVSRVPGAGGGSGAKGRVEWKQTLGYDFSYPYDDLPPGGGGVSAVDLDSKGNLWAFQRNPDGKTQLFKFGPNHKLILTVGQDVLTHQYKAHGIKVDAQDNVWICDADGSTIKKISPEGKVLLTLGERGNRGDWDEAKAQRLIWQPVQIDFSKSGEMYIFEGHANESPNDTESGIPTNNAGAARVIHLDKNGNFLNQWYGNAGGPGRFYQTHGSAVDPISGDVYIGDREEYRIVVYDANGRFKKTIQTRNLVCALYFEKNGQLWMASGQDGQFLKIDRDGNVLGAVGNGSGRGSGEFIEASYFTMDAAGNMYAGDTSVGRITLMLAPKKR